MSVRTEALEPRRLMAAGELDPTFGQGGAVAMRVGDRDVLQWVGEAPGGKLLAAITVGVGRGPKLNLVRFNRDGTRDLTYGVDGVAVVPAWAGTTHFAVGPQGHVAVGDHERMVVMNPAGAPDTTYGPNGSVSLIDILAASADSAWKSPIFATGRFTADNKLVVAAGVGGLAGTAVFRLGADGKADTTFGGGDGVSVSNIAAFQNNRFAVAGDGTVLVPVSTLDFEEVGDVKHWNRDVYLLRFDPSGNELDPHVLFSGDELDEPYYADLAAGPDGSVAALAFKPGLAGRHTA
jgi:uncharacterized delta-60 repeat protein